MIYSRAWAEIDLNGVRANVAALRSFLTPEAQVLAVVKANGYGHGAPEVAKAALSAGATWLGVATVDEGITLREHNIHAPILLLCPFDPDEAGEIIAYELTPTIGDSALLDAFCWNAGHMRRTPDIHMDIDTGIGRAGILPSHAIAFYQQAVARGLRVTGLCTHFANADGPDDTFTRGQIQTFHSVLSELEALGAHFDFIHLSNSGGVQNFGATGGNLVRPGLLLYGIGDLPNPPAPFPDSFAGVASDAPTGKEEENALGVTSSVHTEATVQVTPFPTNAVSESGKGARGVRLTPVLTLKAVVSTVRELPEDAPISYGMTHRLTRTSRVATVLIGYGDGYSRRLSNRGSMLIRGQRAPILGRVCMDQTVVDVTDIPEAAPGDHAVCIGAQGDERITVEEIARLIDATEHEITTGLTARIPRSYNSL